MAKGFDLDTIYSMARRNIRPAYRRLRRMDAADWLASVGLERRNVTTDVLSAGGFILLGCAVGVGLGLLLAPKPGIELRSDLNKRIHDAGERLGFGEEQRTYAS